MKEAKRLTIIEKHVPWGGEPKELTLVENFREPDWSPGYAVVPGERPIFLTTTDISFIRDWCDRVLTDEPKPDLAIKPQESGTKTPFGTVLEDGLDWNEARLRMMKRGAFCKRALWKSKYYLIHSKNPGRFVKCSVIAEPVKWTPSDKDREATDWQEIQS